MATRQARSAARRRAYHQAKLDAAGDDRSRFWAACGALAATARQAGRLDDATAAVLAVANTIRNGSRP
jgi:hypothetical protein